MFQIIYITFMYSIARIPYMGKLQNEFIGQLLQNCFFQFRFYAKHRDDYRIRNPDAAEST